VERRVVADRGCGKVRSQPDPRTAFRSHRTASPDKLGVFGGRPSLERLLSPRHPVRLRNVQRRTGHETATHGGTRRSDPRRLGSDLLRAVQSGIRVVGQWPPLHGNVRTGQGRRATLSLLSSSCPEDAEQSCFFGRHICERFFKREQSAPGAQAREQHSINRPLDQMLRAPYPGRRLV
jgi:hypothetical protein